MKLYKIKKSGIDNKGRGLYATRDIKEGTKIIDYVGKLITKKQSQDSDKYDNNKPIYLFVWRVAFEYVRERNSEEEIQLWAEIGYVPLCSLCERRFLGVLTPSRFPNAGPFAGT